MTLRGKVLEIGGVKEKVMAAYRAGLRQVIMPKSNEKDLRGIPQEMIHGMTFTFVSTMDEVFHLALLPKASFALADSPEPAIPRVNAVGDSAGAAIHRQTEEGATS
jgi:ATP-dependent Lon protease